MIHDCHRALAVAPALRIVLAHEPGLDGKITITTDYYPTNLDVLSTLLQKRHTLATLLGYESWAQYVTEDKMVKTPKAARDFIEKVSVESNW